MLIRRVILLTFLLLSAAQAKVAVRSDTTIKGHSYQFIAAPDLLAALRSAPTGSVLEYRDKVVRGPLFAPTADLDTIGAHLDIAQVIFLSEVALNHIVFTGDVRLADIEFRGGLSALKTRFDSGFNLVRSASRKHTSFKKAVFAETSDFSGSTFAQTTSFIESHFTRAIFAHVRFEANTYFDRAHFGDDADFRDAFFANNVQFKNAHWRGTADFGGARFVQRTRFWQARFDGSVDFDNARSRGEISFDQTTFSGPVSFRHITFVHPVGFAQAVFKYPVTFANSRFKKAVNFSGARFHADLDLKAYFKSGLDLRHSRGPSLDLLPPAGDRAAGNPDSTFTDTARIYLQHANFSNILFRWSQVEGRLATADSTDQNLQPIYAQLRHHLLAQGLFADARACFAAAMEYQLRGLTWTAPSWYGLQFWRLTTFYSTSLYHLVFCAGGCIVLFALCYRLAPGANMSLGAGLLFSFQTFFRTAPFTEIRGLARLLAALQTLLGWLGLGLFIATLIGLS